MARYTGPKCRQCRREGVTICGCKKCAANKRPKPPGIQRWHSPKKSDYAQQLREKQKVKRYYGVLERQFRRFFTMAEKIKGNTGENLIIILERRLDNVLYRTGFGTTRPFARQMVNHGHVLVNGQKVDIASYLVKPGDVITARKTKSADLFKTNLEEAKGRGTPSWLEIEEEEARAKVIGLPVREEVELPISVQLIVEYCSR